MTEGSPIFHLSEVITACPRPMQLHLISCESKFSVFSFSLASNWRVLGITDTEPQVKFSQSLLKTLVCTSFFTGF